MITMAFCFYSHPLKISLLYLLSLFAIEAFSPVVNNVKVIKETFSSDKNLTFVKMLLKLRGEHLEQDVRIKLTTDVDGWKTCDTGDNFQQPELILEKWFNNTLLVMSVEVLSSYTLFAQLSLCIANSSRTAINGVTKWIFQENSLFFRTKSQSFARYGNSVFSSDSGVGGNRRVRRAFLAEAESADMPVAQNLKDDLFKVRLFGLRLEYSDPPATYEGDGTAEPTLLVDSVVAYRLFGTGWSKNTVFVWTEENDGVVGSPCEYIIGAKSKIDGDENSTTVLVHMKVPSPLNGKNSAVLYMCYKDEEPTYRHLGNDTYLQIKIRERFIPLWLQLVIIVVCLSFSSLFSGLNLGLLSLNQTDLKIISNTGTDVERRYAKAIYPVRKQGNYLLCSILLGNVLVNSIFTILLDDLSSGIVAVAVATLCIVIVGEICPQAVCSRHGLAIGAKTIYITKTVMVLTAPLSWPLSRLLDFILGEEISTTYTRERLKELVKVTTEYNDLEKDEVNIISGALELRKKTVAEVMTKIEDVYMLSYDTILDFETVSEIMKSGYSRIPVYEGTRRNIVSLLYIKDLALIDPDDNTPLKTLSQFYQNSCYCVFEDTTLDVVFKQFKDGCKGHMAFVRRVNNEGEGDPFYETVGIVTLEDVIEELIQAEIMDETDVYTDNRTKQRRSERMLRNQDFSLFAERSENQRVHISPQLNLAAFQFLTSSVDAFKPESISETVLMRLLRHHDVVFHIKMKDKVRMKDDPACIIYQQGKPAEWFVLILEGRVEVTVGRENLVFESGPFTYFGSQALIPNIGVAESPTNVAQPMGSLQSVNLDSILRYSFVPDYTVRAVTEVFYFRIKRSHYLAAKKATLLERSKKVSNAGEHFDDEVEKLLHNFDKNGSGDEDTKSQVSRDGSFSTHQNLQYIEDSLQGSPVSQGGGVNKGSVSCTVSPSRTPRSTEQTEEKATLLGDSSSGLDEVAARIS